MHQPFLLAISQTVDDLEQRKQDIERMSMAFEIAVKIQHETEGCPDVDILCTCIMINLVEPSCWTAHILESTMKKSTTSNQRTYQSDVVGYSLNHAPVWGSVNITTFFSFRFFFGLGPMEAVACPSCSCCSCESKDELLKKGHAVHREIAFGI